MFEPMRHLYSRRAGLAAALILLVICLVLLGSLAAAAQGPSSPAVSEEDPYDLQVSTWHMTEGTPAQSGGVALYGIWYANMDAPGTASDVVITDDLPPGTTFVDDTTDFPVDYDAASGTVTWQLGTVEPGQNEIFWVTLGILAPAGTPIDPNHVSIGPTDNDSNPDNNENTSGPLDVIGPVDIDLEVSKGPEPGDPMAGQELQYRIDWCNHSEVSVGPVTLTDTLPANVTYVDWYPDQPWQRYWNLQSADDLQVVLEAPGVPAGWCQQLYLVLLLDEGLPMGTQLVNHVEIYADGDETLGNNAYVSEDTFVSPLRADLAVDKQFNGGETYPGGWIEYSGRYWNQGNVAVGGWLEDRLPEGTTYRVGSAHFSGVQIDPIDPPYGDVLEWDLGTVPVNQGADFSFIVDITGAAADALLTNCIEVGHDQTETTPWDNESCAEVKLFDPGPNLHVEKRSQWNHEQINYSVFVANLGNEMASGVVVTDTYPLGTTWADGPGGADYLGYEITARDDDHWVMEIPELQPGQSGWLDFNLAVTNPGARPAWYTNTLEISGTLTSPDVNWADNSYTDVLVIPEVDNVSLWLEPNGQSNMWGEAQAGAVVTVTIPAPEPALDRVYTATVGMDECLTCWGIEDTGIVYPGDTIIVESGAALMPLEFQVPDPFTAVVDREGDPNAVRGMIGGWEEQPVEVRSWWDGASRQDMTDAAGNYEVLYEDPIPPGAQGVTYFETMVNFSRVSFFRHFRDMSLLLQVNYSHDWIQGEYEVDHTVYLTVEKPAEFSPVYTVTLTTQEGVGEFGGFYSDWGEWHPERPNLEPHDLVFARLDNGYEASLEIGAITGMVDADNDSVAGTVEAIWLPTDEVNVECQPWGAPGETPSKWSTAPTDGSEPGYSCSWDPDTEWDVQPGQDIGVSYYEPEGHQVMAGFSTPWMRVNYGHDQVGGNYPVGHTFAITVTESDESTVKGTAGVETTDGGGWGGPGFETHEDNWIGQQPDIQAGDYVYFHSDDGYDHVVRVGDIGGVLDLEGDSISGQIFASWFVVEPEVELQVECQPWGAPEGTDAQPQNSSAGPDGDPPYSCHWDWWDIVPGQDVGVMYIEPDDADRVMNAFREPAPDMSVNKQSEGSDKFAPGGQAVFTINWSNDGDGAATSATMTDTLPSGVTYVMDTSAFAHSYDPIAGTVTWALGSVEPGEGGQLQLVVAIASEPAPEPELVNMVDISAEFDPNPDNDHAEAMISLATEPSVELYVGKQPSPGDPTPGSTYVYEIHYGNNGSVATGAAILTDILPLCTSVVDWYSQNGYELWSVDTLSPDFVLTAPTLPGGGWGDQIILRLRVDGACTEDQLVNEVVLAAEGADTVSDVNDKAWLSDPYRDAHLEKNFGGGELVPGGAIGYNLHVANHSNMTTTISLTDYLPAGATFNQSWSWDGRDYVPIGPSYLDDDTVTWNLGEIPPGAWINIDLNLDIDPVLEYDTTLTNCAEIFVAEGDNQPSDNWSCRADALRQPGPNLRIYKDYSWNWEGQIHYEINFQNVGTEPLYAVEIVDELPPGISFDGVSWGSDFWQGIDYAEPGGNPTWTIAELHPGWSSRIWFDADLDAGLIGLQGEAYTNMASADVPDDVWPDDNTAEVTAYTGPDIWVEKWISDGEPRPGELVTFTVEFGNRNQWPWNTDPGAEEPQTTISDTLPAELTFVTATAPGNPGEEWPPEEDGNTLTWGWGPMGPGSWWTFQIVALVSEDVEEGDVIVNRVAAWSNGDDIDPLTENNTFELEITILPPNYTIYLPVILKNY